MLSFKYWYLGALSSLLGAVVGCGEGFDVGACQETRSCSPPGGANSQAGSVGAVDDSDVGVAGSASGGGGAKGGGDAEDPDTADGGTSNSATIEAECTSREDCSNGDPEDGEELCRHGKCGAGDAPPRVVAVTPGDGADDGDPHGGVVIEFSEELDASTVTDEAIQVLDGDLVVEGSLDYADSKATFTPRVPLRMRHEYRVLVAESVEDDVQQGMRSAFESTFTTRDGAWTTIDVVSGGLRTISPQLPISESGEVLLAWKGKGAGSCPASAQQFLFGEALGDLSVFNPTDTDCRGLNAAANAAGAGVVLWQTPARSNGVYATQFREGAWQSSPTVVTTAIPAESSGNENATNFGLGVSPTGMTTMIAHKSSGTIAWQTDENGAWTGSPVTLSSDEPFMTQATRLAFDDDGNGLAIWKARHVLSKDNSRNQLLVSRFSKQEGRWFSAVALPTSGVNGEPGGPALALNDAGDGFVLWEDQDDGNFHLKATSFSKAGGLGATPAYIEGTESRGGFGGDVQLVFDGQTFVAAWTAMAQHDSPEAAPCGISLCVYSARLDRATSKWKITPHSTTADMRSAGSAPSLATDRSGALLLAWHATGGGSAGSVFYQRYLDGGWAAPQRLPGGESGGATSIGMNASGMAAVAWGEVDSNRKIKTLRLASFY